MWRTLVLVGAIVGATFMGGCQSTNDPDDRARPRDAGTPAPSPASSPISAPSRGVVPAVAVGYVAFEHFTYRGIDPHAPPIRAGEFLNPILAGFYPDPSICRAGDAFYLVNSTFAYWPGIPIFTSTDLVHWRQLGHVLDRPSQLQLFGRPRPVGISEGIFAPAIAFHEGVFYVVTTAAWAGGNFFVTATNPAGPWSDPVPLPDVDGIDPSFVFDGPRTYIVHNGPPEGPPLYDGHRTIRIREIDRATGKALGPSKVLINGGMRIEEKPVWSEGPHIYHVGEWYFLTCAEGGTGPAHRQMIYRARNVDGPYEPWPGNPILTQRDLPNDRPAPITCAGHADLVELPDGSWWGVFLGVRPYAQAHHNTGRETFLLPVTWRDGWPTMLEPGVVIPRALKAPANLKPTAAPPMTGSFDRVETFDADTLRPEWITLRGPSSEWAHLRDGTLQLQARDERLAGPGVPSFIARRQQHERFTADTTLVFGPAASDATDTLEAGLVAFQSDRRHYFLGVRTEDGKPTHVFLERAAGGPPETIAQVALSKAQAPRIAFKLEVDAGVIRFFYAIDEGAWHQLAGDEDATILSTSRAGGFVGATVGMHARRARSEAGPSVP